MTNLLSNSNSKLKKDGILTFGLPAQKTCPMAGACKRFCYASKNFYVMPNVRAAQSRRLAATRSHAFVPLMVAELVRRKPRLVRVHDSGDFYSLDYLTKWLAIAHQCPNVRFYAYTKSIHLIEQAKTSGMWPDNFHVIYSYGGKLDGRIDTDKHHHAKIFDSEEQLNRAGYVNGSDTDMVAACGVVRKIGLVRH